MRPQIRMMWLQEPLGYLSGLMCVSDAVSMPACLQEAQEVAVYMIMIEMMIIMM